MRNKLFKQIESKQKFILLLNFNLIVSILIFTIKLCSPYFPSFRVFEAIFFSFSYIFIFCPFILIKLFFKVKVTKFINLFNPVRKIFKRTTVFHDNDIDVDYIVFPKTKLTKECVVAFLSFNDFLEMMINRDKFTDNDIESYQLPNSMINYFLSNMILRKSLDETYCINMNNLTFNLMADKYDKLEKTLNDIKNED